MDMQGKKARVGRDGVLRAVDLTPEDVAQRQKDHDAWLAKLEEERNAPPPMNPNEEIMALKAAVANLEAKVNETK